MNTTIIKGHGSQTRTGGEKKLNRYLIFQQNNLSSFEFNRKPTLLPH
jgi:hypothetical protein